MQCIEPVSGVTAVYLFIGAHQTEDLGDVPLATGGVWLDYMRKRSANGRPLNLSRSLSNRTDTKKGFCSGGHHLPVFVPHIPGCKMINR